MRVPRGGGNKGLKELTDVWLCGERQLVPPSLEWGGGRKGGKEEGKEGARCWRLTVNGDPDLGVVVAVGDLPDIKGFRGGVGQQAEEQDDGVGRGKTFRMDLPGRRLKIHASVMRRGRRGTLADVTSAPPT